MEEVITGVGWLMLVWYVWLVAPTPAQAQEYETVTVSWDHVTHRENGDELPPEDLLFYEVHVNQLPVYEGDIVVHEISPDKNQHPIQVLASECYTFTAYAAATGSPSCSSQQYLLSAPSEAITHCTGEGTLYPPPNPPREFP